MLSEADRLHADLLFARANSGEASLEEAAARELASWSAADPAREQYVHRLRVAHGFLGASSIVLLDRLHRQENPAPASWRRAASGWASASACAAVLAGLLWWWNPVLDEYRGATRIGERRTVQLADGSRVILNTGSRLTATLRLRSRESVLEEGEALFEVAPSGWRPFRTRAGEADIRVVGTIYNVRVGTSGTRVAVVEGRVEVRTSDHAQPTLLVAGEALDTASGNIARPGPAELNALTAWRDGKLVFDDLPVSAVLIEAGRYRTAPIRLADPEAGSARISGVFSADNVDALLRLLPEVAPVVVAFAPDGEAVVSAKPVVSASPDAPFTAPVPIDPKIR